MQIKNPNKKLKFANKIIAIIIVFLAVILGILILLGNQDDNRNLDDIYYNGEEDPTEAKTTILDIASIQTSDAYEILQTIIRTYGEPKPEGLIKVLEEQKDKEPPSFETVTWNNIKYGYDLSFNFWSDGSLASKDTYYFTGHNRKGHNVIEILELVNIPQDSADFKVNINDIGGAVFNVSITPIEATQDFEEEYQEELGDLAREEILEILEKNAHEEYPNNPARAQLEYENQVKALDWVLEVEKYPDIMKKAKKDWGHNYIMIRWQYERDREAHERTL